MAELVSARRRNDPLTALSTREREVLALMAEGRSNAGIAHQLWVTEGTVENTCAAFSPSCASQKPGTITVAC
ncbi:MAG TPA: helix-turn-helix transcriptional regulator [Pseudonocardiaceae bacterium]|nr:helix-turn-helix transcriptional regulator [Pseudonocardiaceae bacterium]